MDMYQYEKRKNPRILIIVGIIHPAFLICLSVRISSKYLGSNKTHIHIFFYKQFRRKTYHSLIGRNIAQLPDNTLLWNDTTIGISKIVVSWIISSLGATQIV